MQNKIVSFLLKLSGMFSVLLFSTALSFADGGGGGGGGAGGGGAGGGGGSDPTAGRCPAGWVWSTTSERCVRPNSSGLTNNDLYGAGRHLAKSGKYDEAIVMLSHADQSDPRVLNYLGYSHRKLGNFEEGFSFYHKALAKDPNFVLAREYLGEGYVATGDYDLALEQLVEIERRCGRECEQYKKLASVISGEIENHTW